jgi:general stress protein YciG
MPNTQKPKADEHKADTKKGTGSGGNFANDKEKASEAGKKGGEQSHSGNRSK